MTKVDVLERKFILKTGREELELPDPDPEMTPNDVLNYYSVDYPDLINANVSPGNVRFDQLVYEITRTVGTKG